MTNILGWFGAVGIEDEEVAGTKAALSQNFPNPFNPTTTIAFSVPQREDVNLAIYNTSGQLVKTLVNAQMDAGLHTMTWTGVNNNDQSVASGVYFYQLQTESGFDKTKSMILLK